MALTGAVQRVIPDLRGRWLVIEVTIAGNYPTGGDILDLTALTNPNAFPQAGPGITPPAASDVSFGNGPAGMTPEWVAGSDNTNGKVKFWASNTNEHANGVYGATELADKLEVTIFIPKGK